jgi:hypothetical protein
VQDHSHNTSSNSSVLSLPLELTEIQTIKQIWKNTKCKAPGIDGITYELLNLAVNAISPLIRWLFDAILTSTFTPTNWKIGRIFPIYKKLGSPYEMVNYRPIALLPNIYKSFSRVITQRLNAFLSLHSLLPSSQSGFRHNFDTSHNTHTLIRMIQHHKHMQQPLHLVFIDISKAYDSVPHNSIHQALLFHGLNNRDTTLIMNCLADSQVDIITVHGPTSPFAVQQGVKQGDPISPTLFIMVLNMILSTIPRLFSGIKIANQHIASLQYADDIVLLAENPNSIKALFAHVQQALQVHHLRINPRKSTYMWLNNHPVSGLMVQNLPIKYLSP